MDFFLYLFVNYDVNLLIMSVCQYASRVCFYHKIVVVKFIKMTATLFFYNQKK